MIARVSERSGDPWCCWLDFRHPGWGATPNTSVRSLRVTVIPLVNCRVAPHPGCRHDNVASQGSPLRSDTLATICQPSGLEVQGGRFYSSFPGRSELELNSCLTNPYRPGASHEALLPVCCTRSVPCTAPIAGGLYGLGFGRRQVPFRPGGGSTGRGADSRRAALARRASRTYRPQHQLGYG